MAVQFDHDTVIEKVKKAGKSGKLFYIPNQEEGQALIEKFLFILELGHPLLSRPPVEVLADIVFEPSKVTKTGWVLMFNSILSTSITAGDSLSRSLKAKLRWNIWMALDNASLFLDPCEVSIQALIVLGAHCEDFSTPNLSWILTGHACRLAQAIELHQDHADEDGQRRLFLFWSLFIIDKSVSLAFGRPPILSAQFYEHVPLPDPEYLARYAPHVNGRFQQNTKAHITTKQSNFGGLFVLRNILLAKLTGNIITYLRPNRKYTCLDQNYMVRDTERRYLKEQVTTWYNETHSVLSNAMAHEVSREDMDTEQELNLGLDSMKFQYHHLLVLITRSDENDQNFCLSSTREALAMLDRLVSTSERVYNGIVWQLLYHPFTPFFVLFGNIVRDPLAESTTEDLNLLRSTVAYFSRMDSCGNTVGKLEKIARVFSSLAEASIQHAARNARLARAGESTASTLGMSSTGARQSLDQAFASDYPSSSLLPPTSYNMNEIPFSSDEMDSDVLLGWLSSPDSTLPFSASAQHGGEVQEQEHDLYSKSSIRSASQIKGRKRSLDCTFDWFSWDLYNDNNTM
ncbi:hypothetical protein AOQ84DRAFT_333229 [Glonium stellatum]|uniref:Xylanolytic transcriptional activator regulatory domain-containing protein n=1 Tax=Glonium stellatum TaxID=574774 RepID=A0A8E2JXE3_9PEZI|nr:hypothetical protein AOQ84DRAFT_333229 [Glonium stellatum]